MVCVCVCVCARVFAQYLFRCWSDVDVLKETLCSSDQHSNKERDNIHIFNNGLTLSVIIR